MKKLINCLLAATLLFGACKKGFLDVKPKKSLLVPETTADFYALLDNTLVFNNTPGLTVEADGDLYTTDAGYNAMVLDEERKNYTWAKDLFGSASQGDWDTPYQQVFYANVVLDGLNKLPANQGDQADIAVLRGTALFHRAFAYYWLAQQFAAPYTTETAGIAPGIPLKTSSDVNERPGRGTVAATYQQILSDLGQARASLPLTSVYKSRPNRAAVYGMLSRVYLAMADYTKAGLYADSCLQRSHALIDYNALSATATRPFPKALPNGNDEVIFDAVQLAYSDASSASVILTDPALYQSYASNDLRKTIFFKALSPGYKFKGNYAGIISLFSGIATDEMYLTRAECGARQGNTAAALSDLNTLLATRWKKGTYTAMTVQTAEAALTLILSERRKELTCRGTRWTDLRRLNSDPRFAVTLSRTVAGTTYTLEPGGKRYIYPIPQDELLQNNLVQNER